MNAIELIIHRLAGPDVLKSELDGPADDGHESWAVCCRRKEALRVCIPQSLRWQMPEAESLRFDIQLLEQRQALVL